MFLTIKVYKWKSSFLLACEIGHISVCPFISVCVFVCLCVCLLFCLSCTPILDTDKYKVQKNMFTFVDHVTQSTVFSCVFERITIHINVQIQLDVDRSQLTYKMDHMPKQSRTERLKCEMCLDFALTLLQYDMSPVVVLKMLNTALKGKYWWKGFSLPKLNCDAFAR